jgi:signal transduction histidine kinase
MDLLKLNINVLRLLRDKRHYFIVAAFSILLNWAGHTFVYENSYKFLYFDMLGTFVAAITLGSLWAMLVALATALLLSSVTSPHFIYLAAVNMAGALYWGILSESGTLAILKNKNHSFQASLKSNLVSSFMFILFAGIGCGLFTALFSSVLRSVVFQSSSLDQIYSLYFARGFKQIFSVTDGGLLGLFANYIADTFIEIPDKLLTSFCAIAVCLTIFKFDISALTDAYQEKIQREEIPWYKIALSKLGGVEIFLFIILGAAYVVKIKTVSLHIFYELIESASLRSVQNYIFLEMIIFPAILILVLAIIKLFAPIYLGANPDFRLDINVRNNFNIKSVDSDIKYFLSDVFLISSAIVLVYMSILVSITGITPVKYYKIVSPDKASPETLAWLLIMLAIFILIDRKNNRTTEAMTLNEELIKKQTAERVSETIDAQMQRLQVLELSWSDNTLEFLRSARHDLINQLEKSKTGLDDILTEVYDNVVKPYSSSILESQKEMRAYIEEITSGKLSQYSLYEIQYEIEKIVGALKNKSSSYINIEFDGFTDAFGKNCKINKLFFTAVRNILDNSVYALQKLVLKPGFEANIKVSLDVQYEKTFTVKISDNAGGLPKENLSRIYKFQIESSKSKRLGEGAMIAGNFIKLFNGYISAQNVKIKNSLGLETTISMPCY